MLRRITLSAYSVGDRLTPDPATFKAACEIGWQKPEGGWNRYELFDWELAILVDAAVERGLIVDVIIDGKLVSDLRRFQIERALNAPAQQ